MAVKPMMGAEEPMDELYGGSEGEDTQGGAKTIDQEEEQEMADEAVAPLKVLMGNSTEPLKEGDEVVIKITGIHGDQATFKYSDTPPSEIGKEKEGGEEEMSPDEELDSMDKGGY